MAHETSCADLLFPVLGSPLSRPPIADVMRAWALEDLDDYDLRLRAQEYTADAWACFAAGDWYVLAEVVDEDDQSALSLTAVSREHWQEGARALGRGDDQLRAWTDIAPVTWHKLFAVDGLYRHAGAPWVRRSERSGVFGSVNEFGNSAREWAGQFVGDLSNEARWVKGEHVESAAFSSSHVPRFTILDMDMMVIFLPRHAGQAPTFREALERLDSSVTLRPKGRFWQLLQDVSPPWDVDETRNGDAAIASVSSARELSPNDVASMAEVIEQADHNFWVYETRAMDRFSPQDLRAWWADVQDLVDENPALPTTAVSASELQLIISPRSEDHAPPIDHFLERLDTTVRPRSEGVFERLLQQLGDGWDVEESRSGDALMLTVNSASLSHRDMERMAALGEEVKGDFWAYETKTGELFSVEALWQWWHEANEAD